MRQVVALLCLVSATLAYDAVLFSSKMKITKDYPSLDNLIHSATVDEPVVFLVAEKFALAQFSKAAAAYSTKESTSTIVNAAKASGNAASRFLDGPVHVPGAQFVSSMSNFKAGSALYVIVGANFATLDQMSATVITTLSSTARAFILTDKDAVSSDPVRVKRVSMNAEDAANGAVAAGVDMTTWPMILPPVNETMPAGAQKPAPMSCLFYLEGLNIIGKRLDKYYSFVGMRTSLKDGHNGNKWQWDPSFASCEEIPEKVEGWRTKPNITSKFIVSVTPDGKTEEFKSDGSKIPAEKIQIQLTFVSTNVGYWSLTDIELLTDLTLTPKDGGAITAKANTKADNVAMLRADSVFSYGWNCWDTQAAWFPVGKAGDKTAIGVGFHGIQVHVYGKNFDKNTAKNNNMMYFNSKIESCTGTFSAASWMGIVSALVMIAIFVFGFLMLNSITTVDRFDDPKQRQIVINVRE